jgi:LmbE family N-acetylglucosaminyl deacetylase
MPHSPKYRTEEETWVALAPHPDDVALSIGGMLMARAANVTLRLVTLTGAPPDGIGLVGSPVRSWLHLHDVGDGASVRRLRTEFRRREAEDEAFARLARAERAASPLIDASLRRRREEILFGAHDDVDAAEIAAVVNLTLDASAADLVLAPLGAGGHVDHVDTAGAVLRWAGGSQHRRRVLLYEDLPYAAREPSEVWRRVEELAEEGHALQPRVFPLAEGIEGKLACIRIYETQPTDSWIESIVDYAATIGSPDGFAERLWELS